MTMDAWHFRYIKTLLQQLPLFWLVALHARQDEIWNLLWIFLILIVLYTGATSGFEFSLENINGNRRDVRRTSPSVVWWAAAVLYLMAAVFSLVRSGVLGMATVTITGLVHLGITIFFTPTDRRYIIARAILSGIAYAGILGVFMRGSLDEFTSTIIMPGILITILHIFAGLIWNPSNGTAVRRWFIAGFFLSSMLAWLYLIVFIALSLPVVLVFGVAGGVLAAVLSNAHTERMVVSSSTVIFGLTLLNSLFIIELVFRSDLSHLISFIL